MIEALPGRTIEVQADNFPEGQAGTIGVRILDTPGGAVVMPRTTTGIVEAPPNSGLYSVSLVAPAVAGSYSIVWDTGGADPAYAREELRVTGLISATTALFATVDELKAHLDLVTAGEVNDALLGVILNGTANAVQQYTRRKFVPEQIDTEPMVAKTFSTRGKGVIDLPDLRTPGTVTLNSAALNTDEYVLMGNDGEPYIWLDLGRAWGYQHAYLAQPNDLTITGRWGFLQVPAEVKLATLQWAARVYRERDAAFADTVTGPEGATFSYFRNVPGFVKQMLDPYRRPRFARL